MRWLLYYQEEYEKQAKKKNSRKSNQEKIDVEKIRAEERQSKGGYTYTATYVQKCYSGTDAQTDR